MDLNPKSKTYQVSDSELIQQAPIFFFELKQPL